MSNSSASILDSPLLRIEIVDRILQTPDLPPTQLAELLSSKIHLLTNSLSCSLNSPETQLSVLDTRLRLAQAYMGVTPPRLVQAESELTIIEGECKRSVKFGPRAGREENFMDEEDRMEWERKVKGMRRDGLKILVEVEEGLGRKGRAKRWRELLEKLEAEARDLSDAVGGG